MPERPQRQRPNRRRTLMEPVEPRVLYSAGLEVVLIDGSLGDSEAEVSHEDAVDSLFLESAETTIEPEDEPDPEKPGEEDR